MKRLFVLIGLLFCSSAYAASDTIFSINKFSGINSDDSELNLRDGHTSDSQNILTDESNGLQPRMGFVLYSTEPSRGLWSFGKSDGTRYLITVSSNNMKATLGTTFNIFIATVSGAVTTYAASLGDKFYFINTVDGLKSWDGSASTATTVDASMKADKITSFKGRIVVGDKTGNARVLYLSKYLDGTNYTAPTNPSDDDATQITVSGSLDEGIEGLYGNFQNNLIVFKPTSFSALLGNRRSTFQLQTYSDRIGVSGVESIQDCDGKLRWLSRGRVGYEFDGSNIRKITEAVDNLFATASQGDTIKRSNTQTTQSDFQAGATSPVGYVSTSDVVDSLALSQDSSHTQIDTDMSDFQSAVSATNVDSTTVSGSVRLSVPTSETLEDQYYGSDSSELSVCGYTEQQFTAGSSYALTSSTFRLRKRGSSPDATVELLSDSGGSPGSSLASANLSAGSVSTSISDVNVSFTPTSVVSGSKYWLKISQGGGCVSGATDIAWEGNTATPLPGTLITNGTTIPSFAQKFKTFAKFYSASGNFVSRSFDIGFSTTDYIWEWSNFQATSTTPSNTTITYQTQSSTDNVTWSSLVSALSDQNVTSPVGHYLRYKASLATTDTSVTPTLTDVKLRSSSLTRPSGTFYSSVVAVPFITTWDSFNASSQLLGGTLAYFIRASTNNITVLSSTPSWTAVTSGSVPSISTGTFFQIRIDFTATSSSSNPVVADFTQSWIEGANIKTASAWINQRYWLNVAVSSTSNNRVFVYDKNNEWQVFNGINGDVTTIHNSKLYFGNTSGIYQAEIGYNDNGSAITSYYKTPLFAPSGLQNWSFFNKLYLTTENSDATLATTYRLNGIPTDYSLGTSTMNITSGYQDIKLPFSMSQAQQGKLIGLKFTMSGSSFWRFVNGNLYYVPGLEPD